MQHTYNYSQYVSEHTYIDVHTYIYMLHSKQAHENEIIK